MRVYFEACIAPQRDATSRAYAREASTWGELWN
jgi:hypothetical protein